MIFTLLFIYLCIFCLFFRKSQQIPQPQGQQHGGNRQVSPTRRSLLLMKYCVPGQGVTRSQQERLHLVRECVKVTNCRCNCCRHAPTTPPPRPTHAARSWMSASDNHPSTRAPRALLLQRPAPPPGRRFTVGCMLKCYHTRGGGSGGGGGGGLEEVAGGPQRRGGALTLVLRPLDLIDEFLEEDHY